MKKARELFGEVVHVGLVAEVLGHVGEGEAELLLDDKHATKLPICNN